MKLKLRLDLTASDVAALNAHLKRTIVSVDMDTLRGEAFWYVSVSSLYEVYARTSKLHENIVLFPTRRTDQTYRLTLTRTQAVALYSTYEPPATAADAVMTYETGYLIALMQTIHQQFFI